MAKEELLKLKLDEYGTITVVSRIIEQAKKDFMTFYGSTEEHDIIEFSKLIHDLRTDYFKSLIMGVITPDEIIGEWRSQAEEEIYNKVARRKGDKNK